MIKINYTEKGRYCIQSTSWEYLSTTILRESSIILRRVYSGEGGSRNINFLARTRVTIERSVEFMLKHCRDELNVKELSRLHSRSVEFFRRNDRIKMIELLADLSTST